MSNYTKVLTATYFLFLLEVVESILVHYIATLVSRLICALPFSSQRWQKGKWKRHVASGSSNLLGTMNIEEPLDAFMM